MRRRWRRRLKVSTDMKRVVWVIGGLLLAGPLNAEEIKISSQGGGVFVSEAEVVAALGDAQKAEREKLLAAIPALETSTADDVPAVQKAAQAALPKVKASG